MFDLKQILTKELEEQRKLLALYEKRMRALPEGRLAVNTVRGRRYYFKYEKGKRSYLGRDSHEEVRNMQMRNILSAMTERIKDNDILISKFLQDYQDPSPAAVEALLSKAYQRESAEPFSLHMKRNVRNWGEQKYEKSTKYPENLVHRTMKGDYVRSKSEVIIANALFVKGIQYRYEELTQVGRHIFAPDFKVLIPHTGKVKIIEHFGMMHDPVYRGRAMEKMETYIENGYRPYEDILFAFEDLEGNIDAKNLDTLIDSFVV